MNATDMNATMNGTMMNGTEMANDTIKERPVKERRPETLLPVTMREPLTTTAELEMIPEKVTMEGGSCWISLRIFLEQLTRRRIPRRKQARRSRRAPRNLVRRPRKVLRTSWAKDRRSQEEFRKEQWRPWTE